MKINKWKSSSNWAVIDTETTGMGKKDQVIEITLMSYTGEVLFNSLIKPMVPIHVSAFNTHGISMDMLRDAPTWPEVMEEFERCASQFESLLIYNKSFDIRLISQTYEYYNLLSPVFNYDCVMAAFKEYADVANYANSGKISLDKACKIIGIDTNVADRHRSYGDCILTRELILKTPFIKKPDTSSYVRSDDYSLSSIIDSCVKKSKKLSELHLRLLEMGVEMVLVGPNMDLRTYNGCVFYRGNEKLSGSKIGKDYSLGKLIERGAGYEGSDFDYFYNIFLNKIRLEQSNDLNTLEELNKNIRNIYESSEKPLKTTFKLFIDYSDGINYIRVIYKTGVLDNLHSQTKLYPDKIPTMQLDQIKINGKEEYIKLIYENIYSTKADEAKLIMPNDEKTFIGHNLIKRLLNSNFDKGLSALIESCINGKMYSVSMVLNQYIFNQENNHFDKIQRKTSKFSIFEHSISAFLSKD